MEVSDIAVGIHTVDPPIKGPPGREMGVIGFDAL